MTIPRPITAICLDMDGVLFDPARTPAEWIRLVGEVLAPALGGDVASWGAANRRVIAGLLENYPHDREDILTAEIEYGVAWVGAMCRELGIPPPAEIEAARLARLTEVHVCTHTTATFAEARAAIEALRPSYALHTATGHFSWRVDALLANLGVLDYFEVRCGPDRVGAAKATTAFYERVFAGAHVEPRSALVVDDNPSQLEIAATIGARTALIDPARPDAPFDLVLAGIEELPGALASL